jgi:hypothetical protein
MLEQTCAVSSELLSGAGIRNKDIESIVVSADLRLVENISALKSISAKMARVSKRIFLIEQRTRLATLQAYALGATHVLVQPVSQLQSLKRLADGDVSPIAPSEPSSGGQEAASAGTASIASMFKAVISGAPIDVAAAMDAGSKIADSIAEDGLANWHHGEAASAFRLRHPALSTVEGGRRRVISLWCRTSPAALRTATRRSRRSPTRRTPLKAGSRPRLP